MKQKLVIYSMAQPSIQGGPENGQPMWPFCYAHKQTCTTHTHTHTRARAHTHIHTHPHTQIRNQHTQTYRHIIAAFWLRVTLCMRMKNKSCRDY